jgi:hypothetical protein
MRVGFLGSPRPPFMPDNTFDVLRARFPALAGKSDDYCAGWLEVQCELAAPTPIELLPTWIHSPDGDGVLVRESLAVLRTWNTGIALAGGSMRALPRGVA